jgi:hypothetical protein
MGESARYDYTIDRGGDDTITFVRETDAGVPVPFDAGLKARCQYRTLAGAEGTTTDATLLLELTDGDGVEVSDPDAAEVTLRLTVANTLTLCPRNRITEVWYEIELYDDSEDPELVEKFMKGVLTINGEGNR